MTLSYRIYVDYCTKAFIEFIKGAFTNRFATGSHGDVRGWVKHCVTTPPRVVNDKIRVEDEVLHCPTSHWKRA